MKRFIAILAVALFAGCGTTERTAPAADTASVLFSPRQEQRARGFGEREVARSEVVVMPPSPPAVSNMIIRTATASIEVDSLEPAVALVEELAERAGGYVGGSGIETGRNQLRKAYIEVKVPAARFNEVIGGLKPLGKLESVNVAAQDVGEEFVDVTARMDNGRRLEQRLIGLLATRTGKLKDVLDVEQSLAQVREEIERYEGRIRYMQAHVAMSTLNVTLHEPMPIVGTAGTSLMGEAFAQAWRNFVTLLAVTVQSLGIILPLALVAGLAWFVTRRFKTRSARPA